MKQTKSIRYAINAKDSAVDSIIGPHLFISSFWIKLFGIGMKGHTATRFMGNSYDSYVRCINDRWGVVKAIVHLISYHIKIAFKLI